MAIPFPLMIGSCFSGAGTKTEYNNDSNDDNKNLPSGKSLIPSWSIASSRYRPL